jgi:hypothetical protein
MRKQAVKPSQERTEDDSTKTGAIQDADLPTGNQDPYERRRLSADQLFLQHLGKIASNYPNMPDEAFANLLGSKFNGQANGLAQEKAKQIKLLVEENFSYAWDVSLKLLGEELEHLISRMSHIAVEPLLSKHKELELAKNTANFIVNSIADKRYLGNGVKSLEDLIRNLDILHSSLCDFSEAYKQHHPALADLKEEPAAPPLGPSVTNTATKARSIFAESFRPYSSLFEAIKKHDDTLSETSRLSGIELKIISELSRKWAIDRILKARKIAKELELTDQHLYHVLKSTDPSEMGYTKALGVLNDISEFAKSLSPIESRLPRLSPLVSPERFSSIEMLAAANTQLELLRENRQLNADVDASVKGAVAINKIASLLVSVGSLSKSRDSKSIQFRFPYRAAQLLVYAYASKIDEGGACALLEAINMCSFETNRSIRLIYSDKKIEVPVKECYASIEDLINASILTEAPNARLNLKDLNSINKAKASLATNISGPAGQCLAMIRAIIGSISKDDESFIRAILAEPSSPNSQNTSLGDKPNKNKNPPKNVDIAAVLNGIDAALQDIRNGLKPFQEVSTRTKINQLIADIKKHLDISPANDAFLEKGGEQLLSIIRPSAQLTVDYGENASRALKMIRGMLIPGTNQEDSSNRVSETPLSDPTIYSPLPKMIPSLARPDIIAKEVDNLLEDLSAEFIAAVYTRTLLASCLSLGAVQTEQKEGIGSSYAETLRSYFDDQEFEILQGELIDKVTIFDDSELAYESDFQDLCLEMVTATQSDIPVVVSVVPRAQSSENLSADVTTTRQLLDSEIGGELIPISLGVDNSESRASYQISPESAIKAIKRALKLQKSSSWLNLENNNGAIILRPRIPLPTAAVDKIIDELFWFQTPIYLNPAPSDSVSLSDVKSVIKLMLPPTATMTSFRITQGRKGKDIRIKLLANSKDITKVKEDLNNLGSILKEKGFYLHHSIDQFNEGFLYNLNRFNRYTKLGLLKGLKLPTLEAKIDHLKSLNRVSVEPIDMAETVIEYKRLTGNPIEVTGQNVFCVDTAGTKLAEDAFSIEVVGNKTKIGIHVVNGAFIVPPDSINRQIAYDRLTSVYGKFGVHQYMLPDFISSGFSRRQEVPSISMFIEIPTDLLEQGSQDDFIQAMSVKIMPSVTTVNAMLQYHEETSKIFPGTHSSEIAQLNHLAKRLEPVLNRNFPSTTQADGIPFTVATLIGFFNRRVGEFIATNPDLSLGRNQGDKNASVLGERDELYSKPLRDANGLLGQHQLMANWGYYISISEVQFRALWERNKKHLEMMSVHQRSLQLLADIKLLLNPPGDRKPIAISDPDQNGKFRAILIGNGPHSCDFYARPAADSKIQPKKGDTFIIRSIYYSIMDNCLIIEY